MSYIIYLDQNVLSNLRQRKIDEMNANEYKKLKLVLCSNQATLVYSFVTLKEISQIKVDKYKQEHIDLLTELNAKYINPCTGELLNIHPEEIWTGYLENEIINTEMGVNSLLSTTQIFSRKISGLPIEDSFDSINEKLKGDLNNIFQYAEKQLSTIATFSVPDEHLQPLADLKLNLENLRIATQKIKAPLFEKNQDLGPQLFRECPKLKSLDISNTNVSDVVKIIESVFHNENSTFNLNDYFDKTPQSDIARAYSLMNWAGYYADDFTKIISGRDRFNSSFNDMQHVVSSLGVHFLISDDSKFCIKAQACFAYIDYHTITCSTKAFIKDYCTFS